MTGDKNSVFDKIAATSSLKRSGDGIDPERRRTEGYVVECDSKRAIIAADVAEQIPHMENYWAVGQLVTIRFGNNRVIGQVYQVDAADHAWNDDRNRLHVHVELVGEIQETGSGDRFSTGISGYPIMGCPAHKIRADDLAAIYENSSEHTITIGHLTQNRSIPAKIDFEKLLSRHFAVLGSTGVGKSTAVSLMLRRIVEARPDIRILLLDPHNEFGCAFPGNALIINADVLTLPFWLFGLDEFAEVIFRGQDGIEVEREMLRDLIVIAKQRYAESEEPTNRRLARQGSGETRFNADTPVPYRITDLIEAIDDRLGQLDGKREKPTLKSLKDRLQSIIKDARFRFMFDPASCGGDRIGDVISTLFRVPLAGKPIAVVEMSGLPSEVVSSVVSVICRLAFDLALSSEGGVETLVVCEEAHRYIPANREDGFWPTRQAIGRIAKEGRKYGVYLGIITQRPSELDPTILSQCNSIFAMRLSNRRDQEIIAGAFNSGAESTISFVPLIANRECIAFGEAIYSPMRMTFEQVSADALPGANIRENQEAVRRGKDISLASIIGKMRSMGGGGKRSEPTTRLATPYAPLPQRETRETAGETGRPAGQSDGMRPPAGAPVTELEQRYKAMAAGKAKAPRPQTADAGGNAGNALFKAFRQK